MHELWLKQWAKLQMFVFLLSVRIRISIWVCKYEVGKYSRAGTIALEIGMLGGMSVHPAKSILSAGNIVPPIKSNISPTHAD